MLPPCNAGVGMNIGFPDVCDTPVGPVTVPIPYVNIAMNATATPVVEDVLLSFIPALNLASEMPMTMGDEPGVAGPNMGPGRYTEGNEVVMVGGMPGVNLTCLTTGNDEINAVGAAVVPSVTNVLFCDASSPPAPSVDAAALSARSRALRAPPEVVSLPGGVVYVAVPVFTAGLPAHVHAAVCGRSERPPALVLDLRGCPGGELTAALELASDFVEEGSVLVVATDEEGDETIHRARGGALHTFPLFLLVDRRTASAAEVFAGALQARGRARVVGERTHGKGCAQAVVPRHGGTSYRSVATFTLAGGAPIEGRGITPDVEAVDPLAMAVGLLSSPAR